MNNHQPVELLAALSELSQLYPDWRFAQLVANVAGWADREIWDVEDEQLLAAAQAHLEQSRFRSQPAQALTRAGRG